MNCFSCKKELEVVNGANAPQYDNALVIKFSGGYGMFVDDFISAPEYRATICHTCAHQLCEDIPWINRLIKPMDSHAHKYGIDWKGHIGWDLPHHGR